MPKQGYLTVLSTNNYVHGVLGLHGSLRSVASDHALYCLVTPRVRRAVMDFMSSIGIKVIPIDVIKNPLLQDPANRRYYNYSNLQMFGITTLDKFVYLDADMLVMHNIDELLEKPAMSAVNAGGMLPQHADWRQLNGGLIVVRPGEALFAINPW